MRTTDRLEAWLSANDEVQEAPSQDRIGRREGGEKESRQTLDKTHEQGVCEHSVRAPPQVPPAALESGTPVS